MGRSSEPRWKERKVSRSTLSLFIQLLSSLFKERYYKKTQMRSSDGSDAWVLVQETIISDWGADFSDQAKKLDRNLKTEEDRCFPADATKSANHKPIFEESTNHKALFFESWLSLPDKSPLFGPPCAFPNIKIWPDYRYMALCTMSWRAGVFECCMSGLVARK